MVWIGDQKLLHITVIICYVSMSMREHCMKIILWVISFEMFIMLKTFSML